MASYEFDCGACTEKALSADGGEYCLPHISSGTSPIVFHDKGGTKKGDYFTCVEFSTKERTPAIYELAVNREALDLSAEKFWKEYRDGR